MAVTVAAGLPSQRRERTGWSPEATWGMIMVIPYIVVFLVFVLVWAAIIAAKLSRLERETAELVRLTSGRGPDEGDG